jgi:hypothetical protein
VALCIYNERYNYCVCGCMNITGDMKTKVVMKNSSARGRELDVWRIQNT